MAKMGRPSIYTEELALEICETIAKTHLGLETLCKKYEHWPVSSTIKEWRRTRDDFSAIYARAKCEQMDYLAEQAVEIAYYNAEDTVVDESGKEKCDTEWVSRSRLKVDTIKWITCKLAPRVYGDVKTKEENEATTLMQKLIDKL